MKGFKSSLKFINKVIFNQKINNIEEITKYLIKKNNKVKELEKDIQMYLKFNETKTNIFDSTLMLNNLYNVASNKAVDNNKIEDQDMVLKKETQELHFLNKFSAKIIDNASYDSIIDTSCKLFVGSTDTPKDIMKSLEVLNTRIEKVDKEIEKINNDKNTKDSKNKESTIQYLKNLKQDLLFYFKYFTNQSGVLKSIKEKMTEIEKEQKQVTNNEEEVFIENKEHIKNKKKYDFIIKSINQYNSNNDSINKIYYKEQYIYARDMLKAIQLSIEKPNHEITKKLNITEKNKTELLKNLFNVFYGLKDLVYEANFYLGLYYYDGLLGEVDYKKAYYYFSISAGYLHSVSFFYLYCLIRDNKLDFYRDNRDLKNKAMYDYLKCSAEEGYTPAMYELGCSYLKGELAPINTFKSLSWHRQACKNGYILSYVSALLIKIIKYNINLGKSRGFIL